MAAIVWKERSYKLFMKSPPYGYMIDDLFEPLYSSYGIFWKAHIEFCIMFPKDIDAPHFEFFINVAALNRNTWLATIFDGKEKTYSFEGQQIHEFKHRQERFDIPLKLFLINSFKDYFEKVVPAL